MKRVVEGVRPQRPSSIPDALWYLVTLCWDGNSKARLAAREVTETLNRISLIPDGPTHGRYRPPTAEILQRTEGLFVDHPDCTFDDVGQPTLPFSVVFDVVQSLTSFIEPHILTEEDTRVWFKDMSAIPLHYAITPRVLLDFISTLPPRPLTTSWWRHWKVLDQPSDDGWGWSTDDEWGWSNDDEWGSSEPMPPPPEPAETSSAWRSVRPSRRSRRSVRSTPPPRPVTPREFTVTYIAVDGRLISTLQLICRCRQHLGLPGNVSRDLYFSVCV